MKNRLPLEYKVNLLLVPRILWPLVFTVSGLVFSWFYVDPGAIQVNQVLTNSQEVIDSGEILEELYDVYDYGDYSESYFYGYSYVYYIDSIGQLNGVSYGWGPNLKPGFSVKVKLYPGNPYISKVKGLSYTGDTPKDFWIYLIPLACLIWFIIKVWEWHQKVQMLEIGFIAESRLVRKSVNTDARNQIICHLYFEFTDVRGDVRTDKIEVKDTMDYEAGRRYLTLYTHDVSDGILIARWLPEKTANYIMSNWKPHGAKR